MANYGSKILGNAVSALNAQQAVIAVTGNNIANVNTEGYVRRQVSLESRVSAGRSGTLNVGNGVEVGELRRIADSFLQSLVQNATSEKASAEIEDNFLDRVERLYDLSGEIDTIGSTLAQFFSSLDTLAIDPSSIELRADVLARATDLVNAIQNTYNGLANLQDEADRRLRTELVTTNGLLQQIANLNGLVAQRETSGSVAADERDQREQLLNQLSEKISFEWREEQDGSITVTLESGFTLVNGATARALDFTQTPDFAGALPESLSGGKLGYIVYDYDPGAGTAHFDLTQELMAGDGSIGGLLKMRGYADPANTSPFEASGPLVELASRVEALSQTLLTAFNERYLGPDRGDTPGVHSPTSGDLDGNTPGVFGFFTFAGAADADGDGVPDGTDLAATGFGNFSSRLQLAISDPAGIAAARHNEAANPAPAPLSFPPGDSSNITGGGGLAGLSALQFEQQSFSIGSFTMNSATFGDLYNESVSHVGNLRSRAAIRASVTQDNFVVAQNRRDELSCVSLDEECTTLIRFQKAFEANARMIRTADEMLQLIVGLL